jgi:alpha-1,2-mannosyltransferase
MQALAAQLGIADAVVWRTNVTIAELQGALGHATAGLHTMWNEHFGIGIVEMMAAGVLAIAHNSGGPRSDIVIKHFGVPTGVLATTATEYADALEAVFSGALPVSLMTESARRSVERFSDAEFQLRFTACIIRLLTDGRTVVLNRRRETRSA